MNIAIITARGSSKRIPRKNVKPFLGKPMIAYAIEAALASEVFQHIVVSTDDEEICSLAKQYRAEVPFVRPHELSGDHVGTDAVVAHAVQQCRDIYGPFQYGCCIYPANPFLNAGDLSKGLTFLKSTGATSAFPVVRYDFPIEQALRLKGLKPIPEWPEQMLKNSQDFGNHYHDAGSFYWFDVEKFTVAGELINDDSVAFPIAADRCQDINTADDWAKAELKYRIVVGQAVS
jgi:N-acylneuraminate cytidylyltransferase